jgi:hypothetical protein
MSRVREVHNRLEPLLLDLSRYAPTNEPADQFRDWIYFAQRYCAAADALEDDIDTHIHPRVQLYGHAIECALKAYLVSRNKSIPPRNAGHDLVSLASLAEQHGCHVTEMLVIALVQTSSLFNQDLGSGTLYKAPYPTDQSENRTSIVGNFGSIHGLVESLSAQSGA